jgi:hypothetical protein
VAAFREKEPSKGRSRDDCKSGNPVVSADRQMAPPLRLSGRGARAAGLFGDR